MKNVFLIGFVGGLCAVAFATSSCNRQKVAVPVAKSSVAPQGPPKIEFAQTTNDFGKVSVVETVAGVFKFKNTGTGVLKVDKPKPSCGCTDPRVEPDTLAPGESGEVLFTIKLDRAQGKTEKYIYVHSNDPKNPDVKLTVDLDYTPLYEMSSMTLGVNLAPGVNETNTSFTVTRTDGKPAKIERFQTSQTWIKAELDEATKPEDSKVKINVTITRPPGPPQMINAIASMYGGDLGTNLSAKPVQTMFFNGQILGDITANPSRVYWQISDPAKAKTEHPTQTVELTPASNQFFELKNAACDIKGVSVKIVPKEPGKKYELVLTLDDVPAGGANGKVTVETSLSSLPIMEVPVTLRIYQN